jgi:hypothetical protein
MFRNLTVAALVQAAVGAALALPQEIAIEYHIKSNPLNPLSTTVVSVRLHLRAMQQVDNQIGWRIEKLWVRRPNVGSPDEVWCETLPAVQSADGLWWITHADPEEPVTAEFTAPPRLSGQAARVGDGADLIYTIESLPNPPGPRPDLVEPYEALSWFPFFYFRYIHLIDPFEEGEDDWIWLPPKEDPPIMG